MPSFNSSAGTSSSKLQYPLSAQHHVFHQHSQPVHNRAAEVWLCSPLHKTKHQVKHKFQSWRRLFPPHFWFSWPAPKLWADRFKRHNQIPADKEVWLSLPSWTFSTVSPSNLLPRASFLLSSGQPRFGGTWERRSYRKAMTSTATNRNVKLTKTFLAKYIPFTGKQPIQQPVQFSRLRNPALWFLVWISAESNIKNDSRQR